MRRVLGKIVAAEQVICILCGGGRCEGLGLRADGKRVWYCVKCSMGFLFPRPDQKALRALYDSTYFSGEQDFHRGGDFFKIRREASESKSLTGQAFLMSHVRLSGKRFLELGCADGALLHFAKEAGAKAVKGLELSSFAAKYGIENYGVDIHIGNCQQLPFEDGSFDVVAAFDLVEHVLDPAELFLEISRVLCSGGIFIGVSPNLGSYFGYGQKNIGFQMCMEHVNYFTLESMKRCGSLHGLELTFHQYQGIPLSLESYPRPMSRPVRFLRYPGIALRNLGKRIRVMFGRKKFLHEIAFIFTKPLP